MTWWKNNSEVRTLDNHTRWKLDQHSCRMLNKHMHSHNCNIIFISKTWAKSILFWTATIARIWKSSSKWKAMYLFDIIHCTNCDWHWGHYYLKPKRWWLVFTVYLHSISLQWWWRWKTAATARDNAPGSWSAVQSLAMWPSWLQL